VDNNPLLDELKRLYDAGDKSRLLAAIRHCGENKLVMPDWVVDEFRDGTDKWFRHEVRELGEALGVQRKGVNLNAADKQRRLKYQVYNRIEDARRSGEKLDEYLFQKVGESLHIGKTLTSEYYYIAKAYLEPDFRKK